MLTGRMLVITKWSQPIVAVTLGEASGLLVVMEWIQILGFKQTIFTVHNMSG